MHFEIVASVLFVVLLLLFFAVRCLQRGITIVMGVTKQRSYKPSEALPDRMMSLVSLFVVSYTCALEKKDI